ncbi:protein Fyv10p [Trichomonascus vanleenenianus]|uniref:glucose-induced degradation complex subunit FYV10 n=1 Tax=Trichomonascus vanleenenianus TaxID=2268995 RepID=UPI003ECA710D
MLKFKADNSMVLEEPMLRVSSETMRRTFKSAQRLIVHENKQLDSSLDQLRKLNGDNIVPKLDEMITRLSGLKRKVEELREDQESHIVNTKARVDYIGQLRKVQDYSSPEFDQWCKQRLNTQLVDYFLRSGYLEAAEALAQAEGILSLSDFAVLKRCLVIHQSLTKRETSECLAWCSENRVSLAKIHSSLEFEVRLQCFIELIKQDKRIEAVQYQKKYLVKFANSQYSQIKVASGLLAFATDTEVPQYKALYSEDRWSDIANLFLQAYFKVHNIGLRPALLDNLALGLSALKTKACTAKSAGNHDHTSKASMCPVCSEELGELAESLPSALHTKCYLDADPVVLPNSRVYGRSRLVTYSERAGLSKDKIADPITREVFDYKDMRVIYPS